MKVGFTGTMNGMTDAQRKTVAKLLAEMKASEVHHGDCIGADNNMHSLAQDAGIPVVLHPPSNSSRRAFCEGCLRVEEAKPYLDRNHDIVDASEAMIATPKSEHEELRSGTWATIRYARKVCRALFVVYPDGRVDSTVKGNRKTPCFAIKITPDCPATHHLCLQKKGHDGKHVCCSCKQEFEKEARK